MTNFLWAYELGFWLMLGFLQAILVLLLILYVSAKLVVLSSKTIQTVGINRWVFKELPPHISAMSLKYNKETKALIATARVDFKDSFFYRSKLIQVPTTAKLKEYVRELQLGLISDISKELKECQIKH